jgi:hypothetical protein
MLVILLPLLVAADAKESKLPLRPGYVLTAEVKSEYATQAAAADDRFVYAVSNTTVAQYDRATGKQVAAGTSDGTKHLNSAFVWKGKVFCAHSNYPAKPDRCDIRVFDPATGKLSVVHMFEKPPGSLVWNVHDGKHWWCCFAHYGQDNARTVLVQMTNQFEEVRRWTFPKTVVDDWDGMSASGGVWDGETLLVSHHHVRVLYRLRVPKDGGELEFVEALSCPFPGQGIAADPKTGGLVGIDRNRKTVVLAERKKE